MTRTSAAAPVWRAEDSCAFRRRLRLVRDLVELEERNDERRARVRRSDLWMRRSRARMVPDGAEGGA